MVDWFHRLNQHYPGRLAKLDGFAHYLDRWHLIPRWLLKRICDRFEAKIWRDCAAESREWAEATFEVQAETWPVDTPRTP